MKGAQCKSGLEKLPRMLLSRAIFARARGDFQEAVYTVLKIRFRFVQTDLFGNKILSKVEWVLIGIYSAELLGVNPSVWSHHINLDDFDVTWDEKERFAKLVKKKNR